MTVQTEGGRSTKQSEGAIPLHLPNRLVTWAGGDTPLDVRIANLRAAKASLEAKGTRLSATLEARLHALECITDDAHIARASQPFRQRFPALHRWAQEIITHQRKRTRLEVAAAFELVAVQCEEAGQWEHAARLLDQAAQQFVNERRA